MSDITLRNGKELPQHQSVNLHYEFPNFDDFKDCDYTCTELTECPICVEISVGVTDVVEVVAVQPPLPSMV
ncbi:hypothetical protein CR513_04820, partial [Mucuna pruriens]